jgi:hypothetical protein
MRKVRCTSTLASKSLTALTASRSDVCCYECDGDIRASVFDDSSCRRHYHIDDSSEDNDNYGEDS